MLVASTLVGSALIAIALFDVFMALFHPAGRADFGRWVTRAVWRIFHRVARKHPNRLNLAGAWSIVSVILSWVFCIVLGFALVYWPHINTWFVEASELNNSRPMGFDEALNVSLGSLITLGGDLIPTHQFIRFLMGVEAIIGFGLLTASVSWLLSIYPALERRRTLAHQATLLHHAEGEAGVTIDRLPASDAMELFSSLAASLSQIRNDMGQFPITYYFRFGDHRTHLSGILTYLAARAEEAAHREDSASVRLAAVALGGAVEDLLEFVAEAFLRMPTNDKSAIMRAYASEHMTQLVDLDRHDDRTREAA